MMEYRFAYLLINRRIFHGVLSCWRARLTLTDVICSTRLHHVDQGLCSGLLYRADSPIGFGFGIKEYQRFVIDLFFFLCWYDSHDEKKKTKWILFVVWIFLSRKLDFYSVLISEQIDMGKFKLKNWRHFFVGVGRYNRMDILRIT